MKLPINITVVKPRSGGSGLKPFSPKSMMMGMDPALKRRGLIGHLKYLPTTGELVIVFGLAYIILGCAYMLQSKISPLALLIQVVVILSCCITIFLSRIFTIPFGMGVVSTNKTYPHRILIAILLAYTVMCAGYCVMGLSGVDQTLVIWAWILVFQILICAAASYLNNSKFLLITGYVIGLYLVSFIDKGAPFLGLFEVALGVAMLAAGIRRLFRLGAHFKSKQVFAHFDDTHFTSRSKMTRYFTALMCCNYLEPRFLTHLVSLAQDGDKNVAHAARMAIARMWGPNISEYLDSIDALAQQIKRAHKLGDDDPLPVELGLQIEAMKEGALSELNVHYSDMQLVLSDLHAAHPEVFLQLLELMRKDSAVVTRAEQDLFVWSAAQMCAKVKDHKLSSELVTLVQNVFNAKDGHYRQARTIINALIYGGPAAVVHLKKIIETKQAPTWGIIMVLDALHMLYMSSVQIDLYNKEHGQDEELSQKSLIVTLMGDEIMRYVTDPSEAIQAHALWLLTTRSPEKAYGKLHKIMNDQHASTNVRNAAYAVLKDVLSQVYATHKREAPGDADHMDDDLISRIEKDLEAHQPVVLSEKDGKS